MVVENARRHGQYFRHRAGASAGGNNPTADQQAAQPASRGGHQRQRPLLWAAEGCQAKSEENQKDSPGAVIIPGSIVHGQILIAGFSGYYNRISLSKFDYNSHCSLWIE